jgi:ABC-type iron transport system FetAB ATPase subunit
MPRGLKARKPRRRDRCLYPQPPPQKQGNPCRSSGASRTLGEGFRKFGRCVNATVIAHNGDARHSLSQMAAEFPQQLRLNIEHVRQSPGIHRDAVHQFLIEPQQPHRERGSAEIANRKSDATTAAMRATSVSRSMISSNASDICGPRP